MAPERWQQVKEVLEACLEQPPDRRHAWLREVCAGDEDLRAEVESLAESYEASDDPLEEPALGAEETAEQRVGRRVGPYRLIREIGEGGMARVYLGVRADDPDRREVAIKLVKRGMDFEFILRRFRNERQIMASLQHPNIARLLDGGTTEDGVPYFVMEYIQGLPIDEHCDTNRLTVRERLMLFRTVCSAVECAHERGIVHRDIKPGNILMTADGTPKLLDFGIAKIVDPDGWTGTVDRTMTVLRLMTPEYASPEQVRGDPVTVCTDVYSLGVLLYELLTGHRPYRLRSRAPHEMVQAICEVEPERPSTAVRRVEEVTRPRTGTREMLTPASVGEARGTRPDKLRRSLSGDLDNIVLTAMRKDPARRYSSAADLSEDIRRYLEGHPVKARHDTLAYRTGKFLQRHRKAALAAGITTPLLASAAAMGLFWWPAGERPAQASEVTPFTTFQGSEKQPAFSPDGTRLAFVWSGERDENTDIYVKSVAGGDLFRLTTDAAEDVSPVWSPDGSRIAFLRTGRQDTAVFVSPSWGGVHGIVTEVSPNRVEAVGRHIDWSPDGEWLALADKRTPEEPFCIFLVRVATGEKHPITQPPPQVVGDTSPAFSPDGKAISFLRSRSSGVTELYTASIDGSQERRLTSDGRFIISQTWTRDGRALVFSSNRTGGYHLWTIPASGGAPRRVAGIGEGASEAAFSRDGRRMAYSHFFVDANVLRVSTSGGTPRAAISSTQYDSSPQFSPDGSRVAFRSNRGGFHEIWTADPDGSRARQLTHFDGPLTGTPRWSWDGRWIAFDSRPEGQADIYVIPSDGGAVRRLTSEPSEDVVPSWSRDGKWVYFASSRSGQFQVWKAPFSGGPAVQVTRNGGFAAFESADGRWLYYALSRSAPGLYRMPIEGGEETLVTPRLKPGYWGYWALAPDGVYFAEPINSRVLGSIFFLRFRDGHVRRLIEVAKPFAVADSSMALSPDGSTLLYTQIDQSGSDIMMTDWSPGR
ncbi:MAG TPA: protein kinase [Bryobacteraceae bacterium]|nr:protein kinase [Bryobacteraceae bacterium]